MEGRWNDSLCLDLEVKGCLIRESKKLLHKEASTLFEDWVDDGVHES